MATAASRLITGAVNNTRAVFTLVFLASQRTCKDQKPQQRYLPKFAIICPPLSASPHLTRRTTMKAVTDTPTMTMAAHSDSINSPSAWSCSWSHRSHRAIEPSSHRSHQGAKGGRKGGSRPTAPRGGRERSDGVRGGQTIPRTASPLNRPESRGRWRSRQSKNIWKLVCVATERHTLAGIPPRVKKKKKTPPESEVLALAPRNTEHPGP